MPKENTCIICGKEVAGELKLRQGWLCYDKGGFGGVTHRHNTPEFYETRNRNQRNKPKQAEQALERLLLHPDDEGALEVLRIWRSKKLFQLASDPSAGMAGIRAAEQLLREYEGKPEPQEPRIVLRDGRMVRSESPLKNVVVHVLTEAEPKPAYKPYKPPEEKPEEIEEEVLVEVGDAPDNDSWWLSNDVQPKPKPENAFAVLLRDWGG